MGLRFRKPELLREAMTHASWNNEQGEPSGPGHDNERLEYQVKYGFLGVGSAVLEVLGMDSVRGMPTIHAAFSVKGGGTMPWK